MKLHALMVFRGDAMERFRLSTMLLLVVIAALILALFVQDRNHRRRETEEVMRNNAELYRLNDRHMELLKQLNELHKSVTGQGQKVEMPVGRVGDGK